ncbi:MAG: tetratricopeptide repeat protein [bacterium]
MEPQRHTDAGENTKSNLVTACGLCLLLFLYGCACWPRIIILEDPLTPKEHLSLGLAYEKNGEFDQAIREYRLAARKLPIACLYLGNVYFQKNEFAESKKYYLTAIRKDPGLADAYNNLAWLYAVKGEALDQAERLALRALELRPERSTVYQDTLNRIRELRK